VQQADDEYSAETTMIDHYLQAARTALAQAPPVGDAAYFRFAQAMSEQVVRRWPDIVAANTQDEKSGRESGLPEQLLHRIRLTAAHRDRMALMAAEVGQELGRAAEPGGEVIGLGGARARKIRKPLGVMLMIYEARPTVTIDGTLLPVCAGNAVLLRGGSEIALTNQALGGVFTAALAAAGLPAGLVQVLHDLDRAGLKELMRRDDAIDVLIPRGSPSLVQSCRSISRIPMIVGGGGVNHLYVDGSADMDLAVDLVLDGKLPEPEGCTALEAVLINREVAAHFFEVLAKRIAEPGDCQLILRIGADLAAELPARLRIEPLADSDYGREFLDTILAVMPVRGLDEAVAHIARYGTGHTETIVTGSPEVAQEFCERVDAAAVIVNGSPRLHDAPSMGIGNEIAISTGRLQVRGPVTLNALMTYSWRIDGNGAVRFGARERPDETNDLNENQSVYRKEIRCLRRQKSHPMMSCWL